ncbi:DNA polymerase epsilon subunit 4 [Thalassophryne amazonica]|uniref:DNA polymerase epsilon subunit 4 n=1 Tax=Thalassophryne amazonica TaxID=390379 RepID=UPI0014725B63|nr:DNA polymerase epsilon subunit 4 [Thalassophryne amazonica]
MATAVAAAPVTLTEHDSERSVSEEGSREKEAEEEKSPPPEPAAVSHSRLSKLPLTRIRALMKTDPDVCLASQESVFIIAKATELFVEMIAKDALVYAQQGKRKTLQRKDLDNAIEAIDEFAFLEGTLD